MERHKTRLLLAGVLCLAFSSPTTYAQDTTKWEKSNAAGMEAYQEGRYAETEKRWLAALEEAENFGPDDERLATSLNNLATVYLSQGKYAEAESLFQRWLTISEKALGPEHPEMARGLNNLAELYKTQGKYAQAEPLYQRSLAIWEKALGPEHPNVAASLNNLALLYNNQGQYAQAEPLYQRSLAIWEKALGPEHPNVATSLNNLAALYRAQGKYAQAEPLYQRSLAIALGPEHPNVGHQSEQPSDRATSPRATPRRSRSTSGRWRSWRKLWGRSTPTLAPASTTWRGFTRNRANTPRLNRFTGGRSSFSQKP